MSTNNQPNILLIITEQHRGDCLGVEGHPVLRTPNMDAIAQQGVRFTHFYSACPSCVAARRSILSGQDPQTHGLVGYRDGVLWDPQHTLPGVLHDHGYQTWFVGRSLHQHPERKRFGYDDMETSTSEPGVVDDYGEWLRDHGPTDSGGWFGGGVMHIEHAPYCQALTDGREKYIWHPATGREQFFNLDTDPTERHDLAAEPAHADRVAAWRQGLVTRLAHRPEGFVQDGGLVAGQPYGALLPHGGTPTPFRRQKFV